MTTADPYNNDRDCRAQLAFAIRYIDECNEALAAAQQVIDVARTYVLKGDILDAIGLLALARAIEAYDERQAAA